MKKIIRKLWNDDVDYRDGEEEEQESIDFCQKSDYIYKFFYAVEQNYEFPNTKLIYDNDYIAVSSIYF